MVDDFIAVFVICTFSPCTHHIFIKLHNRGAPLPHPTLALPTTDQCLVILLAEPHEELVGGIKQLHTQQLKKLSAQSSPVQT